VDLREYAACSLLKVDGLVVSRIVAVGHTGGKQALTILLSLGQAYAQSYARISLSVIEGKAGRVEGHFTGMKNCTLGGLVKNPEKVMAALASKAIDDYPEASEVKLAKDAPQTAEAESLPEAQPGPGSDAPPEELPPPESAPPSEGPEPEPPPLLPGGRAVAKTGGAARLR
jgi:hypothetical protein